MNNNLRIGLAMVALVAFSEASLPAQEDHASAISLRIITDQPEAALSILDKRAQGEAIAEADWQRHRETEGYRRLKKRSESFGGTGFDAKFESFLGEAPEVLAMLAAAGGPEVDPQADSDPEQKATWARNLARFDEDIARLEAFFLDVAAGKLSDEERRQQGFTFINTDEAPQGAFYTVGWQMAAMVEQSLGREIIIRSVCDPRELLVAYNQVASASAAETAPPPALWSEMLLAKLRGR